MDRRDFLRGTGYAIGTGLIFPANLQKLKLVTNGTDFKNWTDIRNQFSLEEGKIHMAQMLLASHPKPVQNAIEEHRKQFNANPAEYWENNFQAAEPKVIASAARYLECQPGEIALTDSTTQGLGILYTGFKLNSRHEILTTTHDHYSTEKSLDYAAKKNGATVRRISLYDDPSEASADEIVNRLKDAIKPETKLVAVTWVHSSTGVKLPIRKMADAIQSINKPKSAEERVYFAVDGVHGFGVEDLNIAELGCDFFVAGTHKWLFGPRGTGILWAKKDAWNMVIPTIPSFSVEYEVWLGLQSAAVLTFSDLFSPGGFHAFDHRWSLNEAFDFHRKIGKARIEQRTHEFSTLLKEELAKMSHVKLHTPMSPELSSGINCFEVEGLPAGEVVGRLHANQIIASATPYRVSYARLAPCITNTEEEVRACIRAVRQLAG